MFRRLLPPITVGALLLLVGAPNDLSSRDLPLVQACTAAGVKFPPPEARLEVRKAERRMRLWSGKTLVKTYPVALGFAPVGDKERQGDGRTPEGGSSSAIGTGHRGSTGSSGSAIRARRMRTAACGSA